MSVDATAAAARSMAARATPAATDSADLGAPLYIAWQVTNECNLACLHCIEESGPGKAFRDELSAAQVFSFLQQVVDAEVPYLSFSGGEPTLHPLFFEMVEYVCARTTQLKIETNGHGLTPEKCARLQRLGVKAVQVSLDGASRETFNRMRVRGDFDRAIEGIRNLRAAGVPVEINYSPTRFNVHEIGLAVDLAHELGAYSFYTGRTMYTGNAVKTWHRLAPSEEQYAAFFAALHAKADAVSRADARLLPRDGPARGAALPPAASGGAADRAAERAGQAHQRPALRLRGSAAPVARARSGRTSSSAWQDPRVAQFVEDLAADPGKTSTLHQWVFL